MDRLPDALLDPRAYPHPAEQVEMVETHISWIFLAGAHAYKVKKPVDLGFLDFSTLERRRHCCHEEIRLNRRLSRHIYLDVVEVVRRNATLRIGGEGETVDYAVRMVRFDRSRELDRLLRQGALDTGTVRRLADTVAAFHLEQEPLSPETPFGTAEAVIKPMLENFRHLEPAASEAGEGPALERLREWTLRRHRELTAAFAERKRNGWIRECHGDLHTANMVLIEGEVEVFDCIEFSRELSCIDIASDAAFLFMDLLHGEHKKLAWTFMNGWLQGTGDFEAMRVLKFYVLYRAMVRAKVAAIRCSQEPGEQRRLAFEEHRSFIRFAETLVGCRRPALLVTTGLSGSGKSTHAAALAPVLGAVHVRSDVERKRLCGLRPLESSRELPDSIYTPEMSRRTYRRLLEAARAALEGGWPVIADAAFLRRSERQRFIELAERLGCPCRILSFEAPDEVLLARVRARSERRNDASEADEAVLMEQYGKREGFGPEEERLVVRMESGGRMDPEAEGRLVGASLERT
ncbi:bifunctional aminoglycoside phosphotransferase/ATP-binding protein [Chlorobium sp. N1]|uniref:bifunctional aminoglycoside phosphotransferase/ATP-binding protein n=1 Tax=Chlorobium sp. N1 TaxID=2491138 RepID=UPI00103BDFE7|nr:bifunctional aminoglycoside phosphotransferase/ATP-binding protein [Chlorobium sp. N1]TCD48461.1 hypothetical protein E0L29_00800 [Chlorobium sp. N1]